MKMFFIILFTIRFSVILKGRVGFGPSKESIFSRTGVTAGITSGDVGSLALLG